MHADVTKRFKSARDLQCFISIHDPIANLSHFPRSHSLSATEYRSFRTEAMTAWKDVAGTRITAAAELHQRDRALASPHERSRLKSTEKQSSEQRFHHHEDSHLLGVR
jgi:hypothetical protein